MFLFSNINKKLEEFQNTPGAVLVDVREADEFRSGHIPGAINQPLSTISRIDQAEEAAERLGDVILCKQYWSKYIGNCAIYLATNADGLRSRMRL